MDSILENDQNRENYKKKIIKEKCPDRKKTTVAKYFKCITASSKEAKEKFPQRGTEEYAIKHYAPMGKGKGKTKLEELLSLQDKVMNTSVTDVQSGELTKYMLDAEILWLRKSLNLIRIFDADKGKFVK